MILKEVFLKKNVEVKSLSERVKLEIECLMMNVSGYAPQVSSEIEVKEKFTRFFDEVKG